MGTFPTILKSGMITPTFKKGDLRYFDNYRPVSKLPVFGNILEKLRPEGGGGISRFSSFYIFDQSCWRRTRRKKPDRNLTLRFYVQNFDICLCSRNMRLTLPQIRQFFEFGVKLISYFENRGKYQNSVHKNCG